MTAVKLLLTPPGSFLVLAVAGLAVWGASPAALALWLVPPATGIIMVAVAVVGLWLAATPLVADTLTALFAPPPGPPQAEDADAIVVLGCGYRPEPAAYRGPHLAGQSLERLHYAAHLHKTTGKPILVSGGDPHQRGSTEAAVMTRVLAKELGVYAQWAEAESRTTWENAEYSKPILDAESVRRVFIVAHQLDMPRALSVFRRFGFEPVAAPAGMDTSRSGPSRLLPSTDALAITGYVIYEMIGLLYYRLRPVR